MLRETEELLEVDMARKGKKRTKKRKPKEKTSFGSVLGEDLLPVLNPVKIKRGVDGPPLRRREIERDGGERK